MRNQTSFYCPECDRGHRRHMLHTDGSEYVCLECKTRYTRDALIAAYRESYEGMLDDASYIMNQMITPLASRAAA